MKKLEGKVALITGATSGIGASCAELLAFEGAKVVLTGRNQEHGQRIENQIKKAGGEAYFIRCDVTDEKNIMDMRSEIKERYGRLDILFNNAGILITGTLEDISEEEWQKTYDVNVKGYFLVTKYFIKMLQETRGVIVNDASVTGLPTFVQGRASYMYSSSKAAVIQFTKLCALNYAREVRVNCICPGIVDTPIYTNRDFSRFDDKIPMGRVAEPEEIAKVVLFLVSDDASYITGVALPIDGGMAI